MNVNQKFKVKEFQWFQMQTRVRQMVQEIIGPIHKRVLEHSTNIVKMKQQQNQQVSKVQQLTMMVANDPKVFERGVFRQVEKKFELHQKALQQIRRLIQEQNQYVQKKFELLDLRMKESNEVILNFSSLKERLHKQIELQNNNIDKIRQNLESMIEQIGNSIRKTNDHIVNNMLQSEKMDNFLNEQIRRNEESIEAARANIQNNKELIFEKNIILESQDFKLERVLEKLDQLKEGQGKMSKIESQVKDMEISIKKAEFRVDVITPLVTIAQLSEALQYVLPQNLKKRVTLFGHKKYSKLNNEVLTKNYDTVSQKFAGMELVQQMQKKNTRQITQMKRKKIISMGIDIDHLTFQARQRYYQEVDIEDLSKDQQDSHNNAKIDEAEIMNLVSLYFNEFTTDVSQKVKNELDDTKAYLYGMQGEIKKQIQMNQAKIRQMHVQCNTFHRDQMLQTKSMDKQIKSVSSKQLQVLQWLEKSQQVERKFYNFCSLVNHLQIQDQIDKQNMSLMGIQEHKIDPNEKQGKTPKERNSIIQVQKKCFSCCGYPASVLSSFKMACLAYNPSNIIIDSKSYKRQDILQLTTNILQTVRSNIQHQQSVNITIGGGNLQTSASCSPPCPQPLDSSSSLTLKRRMLKTTQTANRNNYSIHRHSSSFQKPNNSPQQPQHHQTAFQTYSPKPANNQSSFNHSLSPPTPSHASSKYSKDLLQQQTQNQQQQQQYVTIGGSPETAITIANQTKNNNSDKNALSNIRLRKSLLRKSIDSKIDSTNSNVRGDVQDSPMKNAIQASPKTRGGNFKSQSLSKQMTVATNAFVQLKKRHLSYLN